MVSTRGGMTEQQEERLRAAAREWLRAADELTEAVEGGADAPEVMELADRTTLARLVFQQTLVDLGWTPPAPAPRETG